MHRITSIRATSSEQRNLRLFRTICGEDAMGCVTIATTFWHPMVRETGERLEKEMMEHCWNKLLEAPQVEQFDGTFDSAWDIIEGVTKRHDERADNHQHRMSRVTINKEFKEREKEKIKEKREQRSIFARITRIFGF